MENITIRQIAQRLNLSTQAVYLWGLDDFTPDAVAKELRLKAGRKFLAAASLSEEAQKMNEFANELEQVTE